MLRYTVIAVVFSALPAVANARADAGWTDYVKVIELIATGRHYYELRLDGAANPSGCRAQDWYYQDYDAPGADKMFELFVDRLQSSLRLKVYVTGVCNINGYAEIAAVSASSNTR